MKLTAHEIRSVSVAAGVDPRTVERFLRGELGWSTTRSRIEAALRERVGEGPLPVDAGRGLAASDRGYRIGEGPR